MFSHASGDSCCMAALSVGREIPQSSFMGRRRKGIHPGGGLSGGFCERAGYPEAGPVFSGFDIRLWYSDLLSSGKPADSADFLGAFYRRNQG